MGLFDKLDVIVDGWLGIEETWKGSAPRYANRTSLNRLCEKDGNIGDGKELVQGLYNQLESNWDGQPSRGMVNWRHTQRLNLGDNPSPEVTLQRTFMNVVEGEDWANEVPIASGVAGTGPDSVDFVLRSSSEYSMIELKWPREGVFNETPLKAAIQVLRYGLAYVFSRANAEELGYNPTEQPILNASQVHLRVLAPEHFYSPFVSESRWLEKLESVFDKGVKDLATTKCDGLKMSFAFEKFPEGFTWDPADRLEEAKRNTVGDAFENRIRTF